VVLAEADPAAEIRAGFGLQLDVDDAFVDAVGQQHLRPASLLPQSLDPAMRMKSWVTGTAEAF